MKVIAIMATGALLLAASARVPYGWTHTLSPTCYWRERPAVVLLGRGSPDTRARQAEARCWAARGAKDPNRLPTLHVLLRKWPTAAELAAWNGESNANGGPLPAGE